MIIMFSGINCLFHRNQRLIGGKGKRRRTLDLKGRGSGITKAPWRKGTLHRECGVATSSLHAYFTSQLGLALITTMGIFTESSNLVSPNQSTQV
jgi:hypothetical protein